MDIEIETYESDGSDGYTAGTWGCTVTHSVDGVEYRSGDGGYSCRETAREWGEAKRRDIRRSVEG